MNKKKVDKKDVVIVILVILILVTLSYIAFQKYNELRISDFKKGAVYGYQQAIIEIVQKSENCQQVPLFVNNKTINFVNVNCFSSQIEFQENSSTS